MPSPFPGMDPYIEASGGWEDFHDRMITYIGDAILETVPAHYSVRIQERVTSISVSEGTEKVGIADVGVSAPQNGASSGSVKSAGVATIEPVLIEHASYEPLTETYLEIRRRPELELVTVIEVLSPSNKEKPGREQYRTKRNVLLSQYVHIVEIDLLISGVRLPMKKALPPGDYFAYVSRAEQRFNADVYAWSVWHPLPTIPIPLREPDPDYLLDLSRLFAQTYDRGHYERELNYKADPPSFLRPEDREWAREILAKRP